MTHSWAADGAWHRLGLNVLGDQAMRFMDRHEAILSQVTIPSPGALFASNSDSPLLQYPEGLTSWNSHVFVGTYNFASPNEARIMIYNAKTGQLENTIGGKPGEELVSQGALLGLSINQQTGDLYASANQAGYILRIQNPTSANPSISIYAKYPTGRQFPPGPEDMAWNDNGWLYASDSNNTRLYAIPPGGGDPILMFGPAGSGAKFSGNGLFSQHLAGGGLAPNGLVFSKDFKTLYAANTDTDSIIAMQMGPDGMPTGKIWTLAQNLNDNYMEDPKGFEELKFPGTEIGVSAGTPLNGPDGLALDSAGRLWVADVFGDNLTVLDPKTGQILGTVGSSAVTQGGVLNSPASLTFVGDRLFATNLGLFGQPWSVADFHVGITGMGGNGNW